MDNENSLPQENRNKSLSWLMYEEVCDWAETFTLALAVLILIFLFAFKYVTVDGDSMTHTLQNEDRLIIVNTYGRYKTGDIVVVQVPGHKEPLIKRVIATEGQTVEIDFENWIVTVDGVQLDEPYVRKDKDEIMHYWMFYNGKFTVAEGKMFVMGDNRNNSNDSRNPEIGQLDVRQALGKVVIRFLPFDKFGTVN